MINLDLECAKISEKITRELSEDKKKRKEAEPHITSAIGVLQEDGVYALYLYLKAKNKDIHQKIETETPQLLHKIFPGSRYDTQNGLEIAKDLSSNLEKLLIAKEVLERTLVYARYHVKALNSSSGSGGEG